jgi:hypothetical protein
MTNKQYGMHKWWANARKKNGPSGYSKEELERRKELGRLNGPKANNRLSHCRKLGHPMVGHNVINRKDGSRICRACQDIREHGRPEWVEVKGSRISIKAHDAFAMTMYQSLRSAMIAAHPDAGGTHSRFLKARTKINQFVEREQEWYATVHLPVPWDKKGTR